MKIFFLDTEFTDFVKPVLISIGLISECGEFSFYKENIDHPPKLRSKFVEAVVVPLLEGGSSSAKYPEISARLAEFLDQFDEVTIVYDYMGDVALINNLLENIPDLKCNVKFMLLEKALYQFSQERGINYFQSTLNMKFMRGQKYYFEEIDRRQHHALVDAMAARHGWMYAFE